MGGEMSGETLPPWGYRDDDEMLADLAQGVLEREAERLVAALLEAEAAVRPLAPELMTALDKNAAHHLESMDTWHADMLCGDLPPNHAAEARAVENRQAAGRQMYALMCIARDGGLAVQPLIDAMMALWGFLRSLNDETHHDEIAEQVAEALGEAGPRYVLGP
jgi:hypothetical protein